MRNLVTEMENTHTLMSPEKAEALAATLNANDAETDYRAVHDPKGTGGSFVAIFENDERIMIL